MAAIVLTSAYSKLVAFAASLAVCIRCIPLEVSARDRLLVCPANGTTFIQFLPLCRAIAVTIDDARAKSSRGMLAEVSTRMTAPVFVSGNLICGSANASRIAAKLHTFSTSVRRRSPACHQIAAHTNRAGTMSSTQLCATVISRPALLRAAQPAAAQVRRWPPGVYRHGAAQTTSTPAGESSRPPQPAISKGLPHSVQVASAPELLSPHAPVRPTQTQQHPARLPTVRVHVARN